MQRNVTVMLIIDVHMLYENYVVPKDADDSRWYMQSYGSSVDQQSKLKFISEGPVSYTHLTLPTKRIV